MCAGSVKLPGLKPQRTLGFQKQNAQKANEEHLSAFSAARAFKAVLKRVENAIIPLTIEAQGLTRGLSLKPYSRDLADTTLKQCSEISPSSQNLGWCRGASQIQCRRTCSACVVRRLSSREIPEALAATLCFGVLGIGV